MPKYRILLKSRFGTLLMSKYRTLLMYLSIIRTDYD